jgi:hypothetical protein
MQWGTAIQSSTTQNWVPPSLLSTKELYICRTKNFCRQFYDAPSKIAKICHTFWQCYSLEWRSTKKHITTSRLCRSCNIYCEDTLHSVSQCPREHETFRGDHRCILHWSSSKLFKDTKIAWVQTFPKLLW